MTFCVCGSWNFRSAQTGLQVRKRDGWCYSTSMRLHLILTHLEGAKTLAQLVFINFKSTFNCIQPHILAERLQSIHIDPGFINWLFEWKASTGESEQRSLRRPHLFHRLSSRLSYPHYYIFYTQTCRSQQERSHILKICWGLSQFLCLTGEV